jgi:hypothetical protein
MLRHNRLIGTAVLALACALPAPAAVAQVDLRNPDNRDKPYQDLRMPDNRHAPGETVPETPTEPGPVIEVREVPSGGFSWSDAAIGAAGMLALSSLVAGSTLLVTTRRRRRGFHATAR